MIKTISTLFLALVTNYLSFGQVRHANNLSFLHTSGQDIVNASGTKVCLKGVGLGNWLLPEGYMWKFGGLGDRPWKIEKVVADLIGSENARHFWKEYRKNYITEADIQRIASLGFNCVRLPINSRILLTDGENPAYREEGFQLIDSLVFWCRKHRLYVILDMHAAPGGQTGANIDDSRNNSPDLFIRQKYQDQLVDLWVKIAKRYKDEPAVAAYDLLNEPLPIGTGAAQKYKDLLLPLYKRITSQIRKVDQRHIITLEGYNWANDWSVFTKGFDDNVVYQFHYYCWARPDHLNNIDYFIKKREELEAPIWVGETGEKGNTIYWGTSQYLEANNIGFAFWPWKKMDTENTPYSIKKPKNWDLISEYTNGGPRPDSVIAQNAFSGLLENIKLANCEYYQDVCNAILTRIPGKIEAENYGHLGYNRSYFVLNRQKMSKFYRTDEPVQIILDSSTAKKLSSEQYVELQKSEWLVYEFTCSDNKKHHLTIRAAAESGPARLIIETNHRSITRKVSNINFKEVRIGGFHLRNGDNKIKVLVKSGHVKLDWIRFD